MTLEPPRHFSSSKNHEPKFRVHSEPPSENSHFNVSSNRQSYDVVIVGAGVVGLCLARALVQQKVGRVKVVEKEPYLAAHTSGRNSGVLHAGIYYPPGSRKARWCVRGAEMLRQYLRENKLPHKESGKLILPSGESQLPALNALLENAKSNGIEVYTLTPDEIREVEPLANRTHPGLYSPHTWTFDPVAVLHSYACIRHPGHWRR